MEKKQFTYKGKTIEELKELDTREFAKYLKSRARRMVLRNFDEIEKFVNRAKKKIANKKPVKTHQRDLVIVPAMVDMKIHIYNGRAFVPVEITREMLGHKLGEFSLTRGKVKHGAVGIGATKGTRAKAKK
jgi:small subunit ribosomal protein S19